MVGKLLHVVVVENGVELAENSTQERKVRKHEQQCDGKHRREKHARKSHHGESDDLVVKQHRDKRPIDPETRLARLQKKAKQAQRSSCLPPGS